ncbi:MAG: hypothetical protein CVU18_00975 [Betaproteobacteria bacterium HGW-Betaproteobacteria-12]|nr:MAG: hypothetical protein CVU18_00975 [Betaproteobacteria bacterium HGW-Betaproteobacteria-12]
MPGLNDARRRWLKGLAAAPLLGLAPGLSRGESRHLLAGRVYMGSRVVQRANPAGFPDPRTGGISPPVQFVFPVAVAATAGGDIFIADAGLGTIFRLDPMQDTMRAIAGIRASQQTRLAATADGSLVVASGSAAPVARFDRTGRLVQFVNPLPGAGTHYDEVAVDAASGRYYGLDKVQRRLEEVMPHGQGAVLVPQQLVPELPTAMAMADGKLYIAGRSCQCLAAIEVFGTRQVEVIADDVTQVIALAAGDGWLALLDGRERLLKLWHKGALLVDSEFAGLGLVDPRGLAITQQTLYVADGASRRLLSFRLRP